jgi:uncharacterized protein YrrD
MSIKASMIANMPIITLNNGESIYTVKDIIYDSQSNVVKALLIDEKGWFKGAKILLLSDIEAIGKNAVTIKDKSCCISSDDQNNNNISLIVDDTNYLTKNRVITENGDELGRITDLYFEFPSGKVMDIEVSRGFLQDIRTGIKNVNILDIITIGKDYLIVKDNEEQSQDQGISKMVDDTKDNVSNIVNAGLSKSEEIAEVTKDQFDEAVKSKNVQNVISKTKEVVTNIKEKVSKAINGTKSNIETGQAQEQVKKTSENGKQKVEETEENLLDKETKVDFEEGNIEVDINHRYNPHYEVVNKIQKISKENAENTKENTKEFDNNKNQVIYDDKFNNYFKSSYGNKPNNMTRF